MNLYHIERTDDWDYDDFSDFVVAAESSDQALEFHPYGEKRIPAPRPEELAYEGDYDSGYDIQIKSWVDDLSKTTVRLIGVAVEGVEAGVICASFHAG